MSNRSYYKSCSHAGGMCINKKIQTCLLSSIVLISFFCLVVPSSITAQNILEIHGPSMVFEGDDVELLVTYDGEPIQARIVFEDVYPATYTNSTTGKIIFKAPTVAYPDMQYIITASLFGEISVSHLLTVKNKTSALVVSFSDEYIVETQNFTVTVTDGQNPVNDAFVWFNNKMVGTDSYGHVVLSAPDVLVTTTYGLLVNKTGFDTVQTMVTIYNDNCGVQLMDVIVPSIVEPDKDVEILCNSLLGPINGVSIDVFYEGELLHSYLSDSSGKVVFSSPDINYDNYFTVSIDKSGYQTYFNEEMYHISLLRNNLASDLFISVTPSEIQEGGVVTVKVTDDVGVGLSDVHIWRGSDMFSDSTDSEGVLNFFAPSVFMDTQYYIYAMKSGFNFAESFITVRKTSASAEMLYIKSASFVNESEVFPVYVLDELNESLSDAVVFFNAETYTTDEQGLVYLYAPVVSTSSFFTIEVYKAGYVPGFFSVEVSSKQNPNESSSKKLQISLQPTIFEKESFIVTVRDGLGNVISNAQVSFRGITLQTDFKGQVVFSAPEVDWDEIHEITVTKAGFSSVSTSVTIKNVEGFDYWILIIIVAAVFVIGILAYIRFKPYY